MQLTAKTLHGLEEILATELRALDAQNVQIQKRAVTFDGDTALMYKSNLYLRTAIKILQPIHTFEAINEQQLYDGVQQIDWSQYMKVTDTLAIDGVVNSNYFNHSGYVALKSKDAIVDQFRDKTGERPNVDTQNPTLRINIHISDNVCNISLDASGEPLFKRGYRLERDIAPLNEVLAAGLIKLTGWDGQSNFVDPMCGSGTLPIEAALIALDIPPAILRKEFGFEKWNNFDEPVWKQIRETAQQKFEDNRKEFQYMIQGSDMSGKAYRISTENIEHIGFDKIIKLNYKPLDEYTPPSGGGIAVMNPPYGERMKSEDITTLYKMIGDNLKKKYAGYDVWILSNNIEAIKHIGLHPSRKIAMFNGSLECKFLKFAIYEGSKKVKKQ